MRARDIMTTNVVSVEEETTVEEIARLLLSRHISAVPVTDRDGNLVGIVSEGDLMRRKETETDRPAGWWLRLLQSPQEQAARYVKTHGKKAADVMTRRVITVEEDADLAEIAEILERRRIKRVPVLRDGKLVGIVSRANLLQGLVTAKPAAPATKGDEAIRASILETIHREMNLQEQFINVTVSDGTVHLWGAVESKAEKDAVRVAAENTQGVRAVDDHLSVLPANVQAVMWAE
jgi:CBS domain-containing protein